MIELFKPDNSDYAHNGDIILMPISCEITPEINGAWELVLFHPIDAEGRWKNIENDAVLRVPSFNGSQRFRIKKTEKRDGGIEARAYPCFLDAAGDNFLVDVRPTNASGQEALNAILTNRKYRGTSNITKRKTAFYMLKNAIEAIAGEDDNSFINRWGGEIEYNNNEIIVNDRIGVDNGVQIIYGKNIPVDGLRETVDFEQVITRIVPKAFNGRIISGNTPWVNSPYIDNYPTIKTAVVEYPNIRLAEDVTDDTTGIIVCRNQAALNEALTEAAMETFADGADRPLVSISCDMILLQNTEEYEDVKELEAVSLGDTVHCFHSRLGIETEARIKSLTWDAVRQQVTRVVIGDIIPSFISRVALSVNATEKALTTGGSVKAESINGIIDGANARVIAQARSATAQKEKVILFEDLTPGSSTYGAMALGTTGFMIADTRTADGTDWEWSTFGTGAGFSADLIVAGTLQAINIIGGSITGTQITNGSNFSVDPAGNMTAKSGSFTGTINASAVTGGTIDGSTITSSASSGGTSSEITMTNGRIDFERRVSGTPANNVDVGIGAGGLEVTYPDRSPLTDVQITTGLVIREGATSGTSAIKANLSSAGLAIRQDANNYVQITNNNIFIYRNGSIAWRAI